MASLTVTAAKPAPRRPRWADLLPRDQQSLGERHPDVPRFVERRRLDIEFSPIPV